MAGRPRSQKHDRIILDAAAQLIEVLSYKAVSIEAIAARANVGKQTIYRRWSDKADLYLALYKRLIPAQLITTDSQDVTEDLRFIFNQIFSIYNDTVAANILIGLISEMPENPKVRETLQNAFVPERKKILTDLIARGQRRGQLIVTANPDHIADTVIALVWMRMLVEPDSFNEEAVDYILDRTLVPFLVPSGAGKPIETQ